ncbi:hypothetical protein G6L37_02065 [Agrobacterium rubi]|nr:hypothetical protein [Agrobacterium rubi]NTF24179.1 hypothetical protein [Agrobacterium rubi]
MNPLKRTKTALPYLAICVLLGTVLAISHLASGKRSDGIASAIEHALKD